MIQVFKPSMGEEEIQAVGEVLKSGWIGLGPKTAAFEKAFAEFIGVKNVVGVNSCTAALDLTMKLLEIKHGHEVLVPTMTFVSTAHVVAYNLATPIFVDVDPVTLAIDLKDLEMKITRRTKAVIPVHYSGRPVNFLELKAIAQDIPIIEDCAHASGALYNGKSVGSFGAMGCFSFHAVKNLAMGDGGAISFNNHEYVDRAKRLRWLGIDKGTWDRTEVDKTYWWKYVVDEIGLKCHMNDIAAAIGLVQLKKLSVMNERRRYIAQKYSVAFQQHDIFEVPPSDDETYRSSWHIYCLKVPERDRLSAYLQEQGIATGVHYTPIHLYPCYGNRTTLPNAEKVFKKILSLPMYPGMSDSDIELVINSILKFYKLR